MRSPDAGNGKFLTYEFILIPLSGRLLGVSIKSAIASLNLGFSASQLEREGCLAIGIRALKRDLLCLSDNTSRPQQDWEL